MLNKAIIFPGQGSHAVGMLGDLADEFPIVIHLFDEVSRRLGYDLWRLVQHGPEDQLNQTEYTQAAMLTSDVAVYRVLQQVVPTIEPKVMAGHSLGEYAALVCAEAMTLSDAAHLVSKRGRLMQQTIPVGEGAMAAIVGLTNEQVQFICDEATSEAQQVTPANYNAIGQVVIAGHTKAVQQAITLANSMNAHLAKIIPVSVPCHCPLLGEAAKLFEADLEATIVQVPSLPVVSSVDLSIYESALQIKTLLKQQLYRPVRWVETIQWMKQAGIEQMIECGPGKVLSGLVKRIDKSVVAMSIYDRQSLLTARSLCV